MNDFGRAVFYVELKAGFDFDRFGFFYSGRVDLDRIDFGRVGFVFQITFFFRLIFSKVTLSNRHSSSLLLLTHLQLIVYLSS